MVKLQTIAWAAAIADAGFVILLGALTPGHDHLRDYISTLGERGGPNPWLYRAIAGATAGLHLWLFARIWDWIRTPLAGAAWGFFVAFMVAQFTAAVWFPCDPDCIHVTTTGRIHYALGFAAFTAYGLGTILWSVHAYREGWSSTIHKPAVAIVLTALWLLWADATGNMHGLAERANVLALGWWTVTLPGSLPTRPAQTSG